MNEIYIIKSGHKYQISTEGDIKHNDKNMCWCLSFSINNDFGYDICAVKKLIKFGWKIENKLDDIKEKLQKIGFERLKERLENNDWSGCEKFKDGNYKEILMYKE